MSRVDQIWVELTDDLGSRPLTRAVPDVRPAAEVFDVPEQHSGRCGGDGGESNSPSKGANKSTSTGLAGSCIRLQGPLPAWDPKRLSRKVLGPADRRTPDSASIVGALSPV